jgi:hypothetical protein
MQVYALDKRFLDPRRPLTAKPTPQEAEEGLLPYSELVIFNTLMYPTQDKQVSMLAAQRHTTFLLSPCCAVSHGGLLAGHNLLPIARRLLGGSSTLLTSSAAQQCSTLSACS